MSKIIYHEAPMAIFKDVQKVTGGDYALVHLFEQEPAYLEAMMDAVAMGRSVILDNSVFELGEAFSPDTFMPWVEKLKPTSYIIPDVLGDAEKTVANVKNWKFKSKSKTIGVVQGSSVFEMVWCYQEIEPLVDIVAWSFDHPFFVNEELNGYRPTRHHHHYLSRRRILADMLDTGTINESKPHHLLGCSLPQEFRAYQQYKWVTSIDTSNPVVAGLKGIRYNECNGLQDKPSEKLHTLINYNPNYKQMTDIMYNIHWFNRIVTGDCV